MQHSFFFDPRLQEAELAALRDQVERAKREEAAERQRLLELKAEAVAKEEVCAAPWHQHNDDLIIWSSWLNQQSVINSSVTSYVPADPGQGTG